MTGSATFDFTDIAGFTHVMETLLDEMRDGRRDVTRDAVDLLLESVDCLREMVDATKAGDAINKERVSETQQRLETMLARGAASESVASEPVPSEPVPSESVTSAAAEAQISDNADDSTVAGWQIQFHPHPQMLATGNDPYRILRELDTLGELRVTADLSRLPAFDQLDPEACHLGWDLTLTGDVAEEQLSELFAWVKDDCDLTLTPLGAPSAETAPATPAPVAEIIETEEAAVAEAPPTEPADAPVAEKSEEKPKVSPAPEAAERRVEDRRKGDRRAQGAGQESSSIRVGIDKVDELINLVGELVITQSMLSRFGSDFDMSHVDKLRDGLNQLARNTRELQETAMQIRMLPISSSFNRFPRLVRDLSNKLGKKVELKLSGENTELDKTVLEKIGDPMVHLVRNSLDHGLETPDVRQAAGKPETGVLHLNAYHEGGNIVIEVIDDGAGLNKEKILGKAVERGLVNADDELSDDQINNLIFQAGFSTAEQVSDVSGRGVGMDVVRRNINDLGGTVHIKSEGGKGSTLTIRLPLTLAILDGQLVRVGPETYIVSLVSIVESLQVKPGQMTAIAGKAELYKLRDEYIPIIRLYDVFGVTPDSADLTEGLLVVVEADGQRVGVFVDDLLGQQQVVIKSLETNFQQVQGLSGATILGDGTVALILDVPGLIQRHFQNRRPAAA